MATKSKKSKEITIRSSAAEYLTFVSAIGDQPESVELRYQDENIWLTQRLMAELYGVEVPTINEHIQKIYADYELEEGATIRNFRIVQTEGSRQVSREVKHYSLQMIIAVGFKVNNERAVQFRKWANKILKDYLLKGYAVNDRLRRDQLGELRQLVQVVGRTLQSQDITQTTDGQALFDVVVDYTYALDTLDNYDYERLAIERTTTPETPFHATYENAMTEIRRLHAKFGGSQWFGNEKDDSFKSSIGQIYQTFGGEELYPSVEEKAAMLLYLVTKNHSFSDGNKRIAATLFLWFLNNNGVLYRPDGTKRIADNTLVALTLMIAESRTEEKDVMVKVVVNLINQHNA
mgnify:CR=1 FL=1